MDKFQEQEWLEAQKISIGMDLVSAAQKHLQFLAAVDRNRCLYGGPILQRAINRYKKCWLPLLSKHCSAGLDGDLVVPLDCQWIWHCHRLNPVQYNSDCQQIYGRILDSNRVASVVEGTPSKATEEIWNEMFPQEPYKLDFNDTSAIVCSEAGGVTYDLMIAVQRQRTFFYQVARDHMSDTRYIEESVARYKGFLHLIRRNKEKSLRMFCVPTYDIDLIWHSHQLQPASYSQDMMKLLGRIMEHNDTVSDGGKRNKLMKGFIATTKLWEETFGLRYWRAGAMKKASEPAPVTLLPFPIKSFKKSVIIPEGNEVKLQLSQTNTVEICLEIVGMKNIPPGQLFISLSKSQPDQFFDREKWLPISSDPRQKRPVIFHCENEGDLSIALMSRTHSMENIPVGAMSIPLNKYTRPNSELSVEKWFNLRASLPTGTGTEPVSLLVAISFTIPTQAPYKLSWLPMVNRDQSIDEMVCVKDHHGNEIINLQTRIVKNARGERTEIVGLVVKTGDETLSLAEWNGTDQWAIMNSQCFLQIHKNSQEYIVDLKGTQPVEIYEGRRLEFECYDSPKSESGFMTLVGFSEENPYGKALALIDLKGKQIKVNKKCAALLAITLAYILSNIFNKDGCKKITVHNAAMNIDEMDQTDREKGCKNAKERVCDINSIDQVVGANCAAECGDNSSECGVDTNDGLSASSCQQ